MVVAEEEDVAEVVDVAEEEVLVFPCWMGFLD